MFTRGKLVARNYSTKNDFKSYNVRQLFLDYFTSSHGHKFIRSSPVIPFCDPTLAFVNAGMNQFKSVFLGKRVPPSKRVVNHQKCIRVGGKHNDLSAVGRDGYHHTFFEMLGNWSFGDYFKKEACGCALELLEKVYKIPKSRLYVTYFGGDKNLNLPADEECLDIWKTLGFPPERIIPFGCKDNFWEMGDSGPCGPCTEIHIDHIPNSNSFERTRYVNAGRSDLTELWNIVFIQYNRDPNGVLTPLPEKHVDTGMGFERLTAILQNKTSNYDTDLFSPIFNAIEKFSNLPPYTGKFTDADGDCELDTAYRILADHIRMIVVSLSDGMLPEQNQKLRRILRKSFLLSENVFNKDDLLKHLTPVVLNILGEAYPEMIRKHLDTLEIIDFEREIFRDLRKNNANDFVEILALNPNLDQMDLAETSGFVPAFKELQRLKNSFKDSTIPGDFLFKLHDTYGLNDQIIERIAEVENLRIDTQGLLVQYNNLKNKNKSLLNAAFENEIDKSIVNCTLKLNKTEDRYKYIYEFDSISNMHHVAPLCSKICAIIQNNTEKSEIEVNSEDLFSIVTENTNFYCEAGGQQSDSGQVVKVTDGRKVVLDVLNVSLTNGCVVLSGKFRTSPPGTKICIEDEVLLHVDDARRSSNTKHHTVAHLLAAAVRHIYQKPTFQLSSSVTEDCLKLQLGIIGTSLWKEDVTCIENFIRDVINRGISRNIKTISASNVFLDPEITTIPGEIYPEDGIRLVFFEDASSGFKSKELCCGTHVSNTKEISEFCITNFKQVGRGRYAFTAVAGDPARKALQKAQEINSTLQKLEKKMEIENSYDILETELDQVKKILLKSDMVLPYVARAHCLERMNTISKTILGYNRKFLKNLVELEMKNLLQEKPIDKYPFIVHYLKTASFVKSISLQKATRLCTDRPILVISCSEGILKARCCVPTSKVKGRFSAQNWLNEVSSIFSGEISAPKGQNADLICFMKSKKVVTPIFDEQLEAALEKANHFALEHL